VNLQPKIAGSAKRRDQGRMNIDNAVSVFLNHRFRNGNQKTGKYD